MNEFHPGDLAQALLQSLEGSTHPVTGRPPKIESELVTALDRNHGVEADLIAHNYVHHGLIDAARTCSDACFSRGISVEVFSAAN